MTYFDEFPAAPELRTPEEASRAALDIARSSFAVDMFDDIVINYTRGTVMLVRHGCLVGEIQDFNLIQLGGVA